MRGLAMHSKKTFMSRLMSKIIIACTYVLLFGFFLYLPWIIDLFRPSKTINVCTFAETFCQEAIERFESQTGIHVNLTYVEIDEQLFAKFRMNEGEGYDVVNISDYMVKTLEDNGWLHKLDHTKLDSMQLLDNHLMNRAFDPGNAYSLPHKWYVYGLAYNKKFFNKKPEEMSLGTIFQNPHTLATCADVPRPYRVCMLDDGRDAVFMAAIYLFGRVNDLGPREFAQIENLLIDQKQWVEAYTVHSAQYFLFAEVVPIALMSSNYMRKIFEANDNFDFAIPIEGSMLVVENLAIPRKSVKVDLAHQFINFILSDEIALLNSKTLGYSSSNVRANQNTHTAYLANQNLFPQEATYSRLFIPLLPSSSRRTVEDLWLAVGFA
jgi:spermidine/putrescine transport system substrate-binding protein